MEFRNAQSTAVAHGGTNFAQSQVNIVFQAACIGNIGVNAFFEGQFGSATHVITLPVTSTSRTFAPVFFHVAAVDVNFFGRAFVETSEVTTEHHEVSAHSESQSHMVVIYDTAVRADRNINTGFFEVFVTSSSNFNQSSCLATADTFLFTSDADRTAADTNFNEVSASFCQEAEAFTVNYVTSTNFNGVAVVFANPVESNFLPSAVTFGRVDAQYVATSFNQSRYTFSIVAGVDTSTNNVAFLVIQQFQRIFFMSQIVFTEYHVQQATFVVDDGQGVQFVFPNDVVSFLQSGVFASNNHFFNRGHEFFNLGIGVHTAGAVVTASNDTFQFAVNGTIGSNSNGGVTGAFFQSYDISQSAIRTDIGIAAYETCAMAFNTCNHCSFVFDGLRTIDKGNATFFRKSNSEFFAGYGLHDCGNHGDVHGDCRFFTFFEFYQRGAQINISRNACFRGITRH